MSHEDTLVRSLLNGLAVFRGLAMLWLAVVLVIDWDARSRVRGDRGRRRCGARVR